MNIMQIIASSYHHHHNGQVEVCITFVKCTIKKSPDTKNNVHLVLLHIRSTPIGTGLPIPATLFFNRPVRGLLPQINRDP